ncbi:MAG: hypothetical protein ABWZ25_12155 [Chitinophagaceae bacterium]
MNNRTLQWNSVTKSPMYWRTFTSGIPFLTFPINQACMPLAVFNPYPCKICNANITYPNHPIKFLSGSRQPCGGRWGKLTDSNPDNKDLIWC